MVNFAPQVNGEVFQSQKTDKRGELTIHYSPDILKLMILHILLIP